jgi:hypothetical protein
VDNNVIAHAGVFQKHKTGFAPHPVHVNDSCITVNGNYFRWNGKAQRITN